MKTVYVAISSHLAAVINMTKARVGGGSHREEVGVDGLVNRSLFFQASSHLCA